MIDILEILYVTFAILTLLYVFLATWTKAQIARRDRARALAHLRKVEDGTIYVRDPQTHTLHRLDDLLVKHVAGDSPSVTPRQQKKIRRQVRQALGAR